MQPGGLATRTVQQESPDDATARAPDETSQHTMSPLDSKTPGQAAKFHRRASLRVLGGAGPARVLAAARVGATRLIDNVAVDLGDR